MRACAAEGIDVRVVPGPSAAIAALAISGLPTDRFVFEGFLPRKAGERRARLEALARDPRTVVLFESPKRVRATVVEALEVLGDRPAAVARELTKLHEEVLRGTLSELPATLDAATLKGEVVVVIGGAEPSTTTDPEELVVRGSRAGRRRGARTGCGAGRREAAWHLRERALRPVARRLVRNRLARLRTTFDRPSRRPRPVP